VAAAVREGSQSSSPMNFAEDLISGIDFLDEEKCIRRFHPQDLPLFDLVLLADAVHDKAPIYSLFANQCYWYANILFEIIVQLYTLSAVARRLADTLDHSGPSSTPGRSATPGRSSTGLPAPTLEINALENANLLILPALGEAGRFYGILINDPGVRQTVTRAIISDFKKRLDFYLHQVNFIKLNSLIIAH